MSNHDQENSESVANPESGESLNAIARDMESFLLEQIRRIEREIDGVSAVAVAPSDTDAANAQLTVEREQWEAQRLEETARLRDEAALLLDAWQQLEAQKRQLLAEREMMRRGVGVSKVASAHSTSDGELDERERGVKPTTSAQNDSSAWVQFQRLRREIQTHSAAKN